MPFTYAQEEDGYSSNKSCRYWYPCKIECAPDIDSAKKQGKQKCGHRDERPNTRARIWNGFADRTCLVATGSNEQCCPQCYDQAGDLARVFLSIKREPGSNDQGYSNAVPAWWRRALASRGVHVFYRVEGVLRLVCFDRIVIRHFSSLSMLERQYYSICFHLGKRYLSMKESDCEIGGLF